MTDSKSTDDQPTEQFATLALPDGRVFSLPILIPNLGQEVLVDVRALYAKSKVLMYDPGFNSTASCQSAITYIDGDAGLCLYRGYPVHELVHTCCFLKVSYLLLYGTLPGEMTYRAFEKEIKREMMMHEVLKSFISSFISGSHPMSMLASVLAAMASFYTDPMSEHLLDNYEEREFAIVRLIAQMPSIVALIYRKSLGLPMLYPRSDLSYSENILYMMFGTPMEKYVPDPIKSKIIDAFLVIHADHEQNASTSTVRTAGSSMTNPYACISSGVTSLWGRAHGGANEAVISMLKEIGSEENIPAFIEKVKAKKTRLMGFGHRIYRNYDPRATIMRELCYELQAAKKKIDPLFDLAMKLEKHGLSDEYFISRNLYPNVDFYAGIVMRALNIPTEMFTVMFSMGRISGWLSHWKEMVEEKQMRISRPRQLYLGPPRYSVTNPTNDDEPEFTAGGMFSPSSGDSVFHQLQAAVIEKRLLSN